MYVYRVCPVSQVLVLDADVQTELITRLLHLLGVADGRATNTSAAWAPSCIKLITLICYDNSHAAHKAIGAGVFSVLEPILQVQVKHTDRTHQRERSKWEHTAVQLCKMLKSVVSAARTAFPPPLRAWPSGRQTMLDDVAQLSNGETETEPSDEKESSIGSGAAQPIRPTLSAAQLKLFVKHLLLPPTSISTRAEVLSLFGALVWKDPEMGQCVVELLAGTTTAEEMLKQGIVWTDMIYGKTVVDAITKCVGMLNNLASPLDSAPAIGSWLLRAGGPTSAAIALLHVVMRLKDTQASSVTPADAREPSASMPTPAPDAVALWEAADGEFEGVADGQRDLQDFFSAVEQLQEKIVHFLTNISYNAGLCEQLRQLSVDTETDALTMLKELAKSDCVDACIAVANLCGHEEAEANFVSSDHSIDSVVKMLKCAVNGEPFGHTKGGHPTKYVSPWKPAMALANLAIAERNHARIINNSFGALDVIVSTLKNIREWPRERGALYKCLSADTCSDVLATTDSTGSATTEQSALRSISDSARTISAADSTTGIYRMGSASFGDSARETDRLQAQLVNALFRLALGPELAKLDPARLIPINEELELTCADTSGPDAVRELANRAMFSILKFNSAHSARAHAAQLGLSAAHLGCDPEHARGPFPQPADASAGGASHSAAHAVDPIGEIASGDGAPSGTDQAVCVVRGTLTVDPEHQHFSLILGISGIPGHGELTALLALSDDAEAMAAEFIAHHRLSHELLPIITDILQRMREQLEPLRLAAAPAHDATICDAAAAGSAAAARSIAPASACAADRPPPPSLALTVRAPLRIKASQPRKHVMVSYAWKKIDGKDDTPKLVWDLVENLKSNNYDVWFDRTHMSINVLEKQAEAVQGASALLMCCCEHYQISMNCKLEALYAHQRGVPIVPLMMQKPARQGAQGWRPESWLGILVGTKVYVDFSEAQACSGTFDLKFADVLKELQVYGISADPTPSPLDRTTSFDSFVAADPAATPLPRALRLGPAPVVPMAAVAKAAVAVQPSGSGSAQASSEDGASMDEAAVRSWLDAIGLARYASKLESSDLLNGQSLTELHRWLVGAGGGSSGWDFRVTVVHDLGFSLGDALRFAHCLRERFRSPERPG